MHKLFQNERGATLVEYGLLVTLVGLAIAGAFHVFSQSVMGSFSSIHESLPSIQVIDDKKRSSLLAEK